MTIKKKPLTNVLSIDLTGPDGNAFSLLANAKMLAKNLNLDGAKIQAEMMSGDYENLIKVFDSYFGDYITLYR